MDALIGLDLGTSNLKGTMVSGEGDILAHAIQPTRLLRPQPGHVEFDAEDYADRVFHVLRALASQMPSGARVHGIAVSGAAGSTILLDENGRPLAPAISWTDTRTLNEPEGLVSGIDPDSIYPIVGWPYSGRFPLAHLGWFRKHRQDLFSRVAGVAMDIDYVLYRLSGRRGLDYSTATTFYLCDQVGRQWHQPYLDALGLDAEVMPALMDPGTVLGSLSNEAAATTGLPADVKVVLGAFDHPSAARGVGVLEPGSGLLSCGTSWVGFYPVENRAAALAQNLLVDPFRRPAGPWGTMFSLTSIGERIDAYVSHLCPGENKYVRFDEAACRAAPGANGMSVDLNAAPESLSFDDLDDACRAVVEAVALRMRERVQHFAAAGIAATELTMVGGPASGKVWPQVLADLLGARINVPAGGQHAGAVGAAILAGVGVGIFPDDRSGFEQIKSPMRVVKPSAHKSMP